MTDLSHSTLAELVPLYGCTNTNPESSCIQDIEVIIKKLVSDLGFDFYRYSIRQKGVDNMPDTYSIAASNFPKEWEKIYEEQKLYLYDPVVRVLTEGGERLSGFIFGNWADARTYCTSKPAGNSDSEKDFYLSMIGKVYSEAAGFDLNSGIYLAHGDDKRQTLVSLSSRKSHDEIKDKLGESFWRFLYETVILIEYAVSQTSGCEACMQGVRQDGAPPIKLSKMQRRILLSFYNNPKHTIKEIADLNKLTVSTINFHLKAIRKKTNKYGYSGQALAQFAKDHNML